MGGTAEELAANLGVELRYAAHSAMAGASAVAGPQTAVMAVAFGVAEHVLVRAGWNGYSSTRARDVTDLDAGLTVAATLRDYYQPHGTTSPPQVYALMARRHMAEFGTPVEALGAVAVACRRHAQLNQRAVMHGGR